MLDERRPPQLSDDLRIKADRAFFSADVLRLDEGDVPQKCAVDKFLIALEIYRQLHDERGEAQTLNFLGYSLNKLQRSKEALEYLLPAPRMWEKMGDPFGQAEALNNLGFSYAAMGESELALKAYEAALPVWRSARQRTTDTQKLKDIDDSEGRTLTNLADLYNELGDTNRALQSFVALLDITRHSQFPTDYANNLKNIGLVYSTKKDYPEALKYFLQAYKQLPQTADNSVLGLKAAILNSIGAMRVRLSDDTQGFRDFDEAQKLYKKINFHLGDAIIANNYGKSYYIKGGEENKRVAISYYLKALSVLDEMEEPTHRAGTLYNLAQAQSDLGLLPEAIASIEEAINYVETLRTKVGRDDLKLSFFAERYFYYELYIELLMKMHAAKPSAGYDKLALQGSERARARRLLDLLSKAQAVKSEVIVSVPEPVAAAEDRFTEALKRRRKILNTAHTAEQEKEAQNLVRVSEEVYRKLQREIRHSAAALQLQPYPLSFGEIQGLLGGSDTMILEYRIGEKGGFLWAVSADTREPMIVKELPSRVEIEKEVKELRDAITERGCSIKDEATDERLTRIETADQQYKRAAQNLGETLLGSPVASRLGTKRLVIVADGQLQLIPFGALITPVGAVTSIGSKEVSTEGSPLALSHEIIYLPSLTTLDEIRTIIAAHTPTTKTILAFADPVFSPADDRVKNLALNDNSRSSLFNLIQGAETELQSASSRSNECEPESRLGRLPGTLQEAQNILALVPDNNRKKLANSFDASLSTLMNPMVRDYKILHLATHAFVPLKAPERATIVLSFIDKQGQPQQGFIRLKDIYQLKLQAELVTLSACETGIGEDVKGEGLVGLGRGFMYAGVPRVVASLWKVDDEATAELMTNFYKAMLTSNLPASAALRQAQKDMYEHPRKAEWKAPFYWAAFTIQGEWR
jgi:CHAT domain-containing protein/Flp pilus assembly protein TadD